MNMGEDLGLMGKLFLKAGRVEMIPEHLYAYVRNEGQQTNHYSELHWQQLRANLQSLEDYIQQHQLHEAASDLAFLKLQLKLPLLVSGRRDDYDRWQQLYPEANKAIAHVGGGIHTRLLQRMAGLGQYWYVWLYYRVSLASSLRARTTPSNSHLPHLFLTPRSSWLGLAFCGISSTPLGRGKGFPSPPFS